MRTEKYEKLQNCYKRNGICQTFVERTVSLAYVTVVDIVPEKVDLINNCKSPIQDDYIEKYLAEKDMNLTTTLDVKAAYSERTLL